MRLVEPLRSGVRIEMVPLIDTFFLLLAFFISSVLSMSVLRGLPVELPMASGAKLDAQDVAVVTVARDGRVSLDGEPIALNVLGRALQADPRGAQLRVVVRADREVPTGTLVEVLAAVRQAGVRRVGLVTEVPGVNEP